LQGFDASNRSQSHLTTGKWLPLSVGQAGGDRYFDTQQAIMIRTKGDELSWNKYLFHVRDTTVAMSEENKSVV